MQEDDTENKILLPHHVQQSLCTTRLPYRQGRKLTAVKVYSITKESNHLLIFGVPSLNLRQETKALFIKFGKLQQFNISKEHACESFTETYHAQYVKIHSARLAKRMLDTKNFYGGILHVCYAPEFESIDETRHKLIQRQQDVISRLKNLNKEENVDVSKHVSNDTLVTDSVKLNMGYVNTICIGKEPRKVVKKRKVNNDKIEYKPCFIDNKKKNIINNDTKTDNITKSDQNVYFDNDNASGSASKITNRDDSIIEVVDCTGVDNEVITNINEHLNYNKFGNEIIRKIPQKAPNKILFHINKKS